MTVTNDSLNQAANAITVTVMSLHSQNPTAAGTVGELTGGGYTRQAVSYGAAVAGSRSLSVQPLFNVPAGAVVSHYAIWDGATLKDYGSFAASETFTNAGTYRVTSGTLTLTPGA